MTITSLQTFVEKNTRFVELEKLAEQQENKLLIENHSLDELCNAGVALEELKVINTASGFDGRLCIKFAINLTRLSKRPLFSKSHKFSNGDIVNICANNDHKNRVTYGTVLKVDEETISVTVDGFNKIEIDADNGTYCLIQDVNEVTYRRLMKTLDDFLSYAKFPGSNVVEILFGLSKIPDVGVNNEEIDSVYFDNNSTANDIVKFCLDDRRPVSVIHGPPGTGKTTTLGKIVQILANKGRKILACAASNTAVDNLVERLASLNVPVVRLGHPARTKSDLRFHTLDYMLKNSDQREFIDEIRKEMKKLSENREGRSYRDLRLEKNILANDLRWRESSAMSEIAAKARVVCCTLTNAARAHYNPNRRCSIIGNFLAEFLPFDCVVVDECAQATELACWAALLLGKRCILAGDHNQLTPTIISEKASVEGFARSLMRRIVDEFPKDILDKEIMRLLRVQYRMNKHIMQWSSDEFYENQLLADSLVADHLLCHLNDVQKNDETDQALLLIDTSDCEMNELSLVVDQSKANIGEVQLTYLHVEHLIRSGLQAQDIAVITPYNLQVSFLRYVLDGKFPGISVRSVDGFQGQEKEAVVLSLVRSNKNAELGFLTDYKRMNVAATRARRHLAVICDVSCVSRNDKFIKSLTDHMQTFGLTKCALEYQTDIELLEWNINLSEFDIERNEDDNKNKNNQNSTGTQSVAESSTKKKSEPIASNNVPKFQNDQNSQNFVSEIPRDSFRSEITEKLSNFVASCEAKLEFETYLEPAQRRIVHEIAESMHLDHSSFGDGNERKIVVEKPCPDIGALTLATACTTSNHDSEIKKQKSRQTTTSKIVVVEENLHKIYANPSADDSKFLDDLIQRTKFCKFADCRTNVEDEFCGGLICKFCKLKFCFKHSQAEVHGCGTAAKNQALKEKRAEMANGGRSAASAAAKNAERRASLEQKLGRKIDKAREKRSTNKK